MAMTQQLSSSPVVQKSDDYWEGYLDAVRHANDGLARMPEEQWIKVSMARSVVTSLAHLPFQFGYQPEWARSLDCEPFRPKN